jgi:hypothetical protein
MKTEYTWSERRQAVCLFVRAETKVEMEALLFASRAGSYHSARVVNGTEGR